ncbi:hypothetical protein [Nocardioides albus]|uniref:Uncharacterized protein n=1 Tax=Nocardioides albus TaxID=1841 RepID=A0A7W5A793_9ACTN|nr:hypothetical protein [Nocardioides albus]MBB3091022.1 hypothetical protein [Nocardioides albus]GGU39087.1 hypothetical protein GCM10007979_42930 [Nocardioides albus]
MKKLTTTLLAGAAVALVIATLVAVSPPARAAANTYTPHGGPGITLGGELTFTVEEANFRFTCQQFDLTGILLGPGDSRPFGTPTTTWDQIATSGCSSPQGGDVTVNPIGAWAFTITGPEIGSVSPAAITDASMFVGTSGCSFNVAGDITGTFDDSPWVSFRDL